MECGTTSNSGCVGYAPPSLEARTEIAK